MAEAWSWSTAARTGLSPQELARARAEVLTATAAPVAELWRGMTTRETLAFRGTLEADVARLRGSDEAQAPVVRETAARTGAPMAALNRALNRAARRVEQVLAPVPVLEGPGVLSLVGPITIDLTSFEGGPEPVLEPATDASPTRPMCERHSFDRSADDCNNCGRAFCEDCLIPFHQSQRMLCVSCALVAAGVRSSRTAALRAL